jgi:hypothetical protein
MQLTKEQFANIVGGSSDGVDQGPWTEKRRATRHLVWVRATISVADAAPEEVRLRDLSSRGVRLYYHAHMAAGQQFIMEINGESAGEARSRILCSTLHCQKVDEGNYAIGAEFTCSINRDSQADAAEEKQSQLERIRGSILT